MYSDSFEEDFEACLNSYKDYKNKTISTKRSTFYDQTIEQAKGLSYTPTIHDPEPPIKKVTLF